MKPAVMKKCRNMLLIALAAIMLMMTFAACGKDVKPEETLNNLPTDGEETAPPATDPPEPTDPPTVMGTVIADKLNVREKPDGDSDSIRQLAVDTRVEILEERVMNGYRWGRIADGWIRMDYVLLDSDAPETPTDPTDPGATEAPTEPQATEPVDDNKDNKDDKDDKDDKPATNKSMATVLAEVLNIRKGPGTNYDKAGTYSAGDRVEILEKDGTWGRTSKGWISLNLVHMDGTKGPDIKLGVIIADELNVRVGPGTGHKAVKTYRYGTRIEIWQTVTVGNSTWCYTKDGWMSMKYVYVDGTKGEGSGSGVITGNLLNIRSGPGTGYKSVGVLNSGDKVEILFQLKLGDMVWGCTKDGWIAMKYVAMD